MGLIEEIKVAGALVPDVICAHAWRRAAPYNTRPAQFERESSSPNEAKGERRGDGEEGEEEEEGGLFRGARPRRARERIRLGGPGAPLPPRLIAMEILEVVSLNLNSSIINT